VESGSTTPSSIHSEPSSEIHVFQSQNAYFPTATHSRLSAIHYSIGILRLPFHEVLTINIDRTLPQYDFNVPTT
jgi:hypothetical protein